MFQDIWVSKKYWGDRTRVFWSPGKDSDKVGGPRHPGQGWDSLGPQVGIKGRNGSQDSGTGLTMCWSLSRCTTRAVHSPMGTRSGEAL